MLRSMLVAPAADPIVVAATALNAAAVAEMPVAAEAMAPARCKRSVPGMTTCAAA